jgi:hypothetical protein
MIYNAETPADKAAREAVEVYDRALSDLAIATSNAAATARAAGNMPAFYRYDTIAHSLAREFGG